MIEASMIDTSSMIDSPLIEALSRYLDVTAARHKLIAANLANVDTPGYRAQDLDFRAELARADPAGGGAESLRYAANPPVSRPVRGLLMRPDGNNVSVERESLLLAETQMKFSFGVQLLKDEFKGVSQAINSGGSSP
jgi:flagellar basal-body rod protein FlgB